jgi:hypothetical protein
MVQNIKQVIESEVVDLLESQQQMTEVETELQSNPLFKKFLKLQHDVNQKADEVWDKVGTQMIEAYEKGQIEKSLKFDFGTLVVADNNKLSIDEKILPKKFFKTVPNTTYIRDVCKLEGKAPKGVTVEKGYSFRKILNKDLK